MIKVTEQDASGALTQETSYTYNVMDKLTLVNQGNQTRAFKYDALGRLLYERIPEQTDTINDGTGTWTSKYTYTDFDSVATEQDARGVITTYSYDNLHRLTGISYNVSGAPGVASTPAVTFTFDTSDTSSTKGLLLSVDVGTSGSVYRESYTFDSFNRASAAAHRIDTRTYTTDFQYNAVSQPTQIAHIYPEYDTARLFAVRNGPSGAGTPYIYGLNYNIAGQVTSDSLVTNGGYVNETFAYDANRMQLTTQTATKSGNTLMNLTYNYQASAGQMGAGTTAGNAGQLMSINGTINGTTESASYKYDLVGRLSTSDQTSNGSSAQRKFAYDRWGNRTTVWPSLFGGTPIQSITLQQSGGAPTNQIASVTNSGVTVNYLYDPAGNVTYDGAHSYVYDAENRIVSMDSGAYTHAYDHQNRRIKKVGGGSNTHYVWEGSQVIAEYNGSTGAQLAAYYYAGSRMISKLEGGATRYFLSDRLSTRVVLDLNGNVVGRQAHLPFGDPFGESGAQEKHHFTTYERDAESGADYAVNRAYSINSGRFQQADPYKTSGGPANPQSWNRYTYVEDDPINYSDQTGLLKASVAQIISCSEYACTTYWFVFGAVPDPDEGSSDGGAGRATLFDVESAVNNLGPGCKKFFGEKFLSDAASFARGITVVDRQSPEANNKPPGFNQTFAQLHDSAPAGTIAAALRTPTGMFLPYILVGANFAVPMFAADVKHTFNAYYPGKLGAWQRDALFHEFMHIFTRRDDRGMAADWKSRGADLGDISTDTKASQETFLFIARDCKKKK